MKWGLSILSLVGLAACDTDDAWMKFENMPPPHQNIEHKVVVNSAGYASVNGRNLDRNEFGTFLSDVSKNQRLAYIYLVIGEKATEAQRADVKGQIQKSGACVRNFCIEGFGDYPKLNKAN